MFDWFWEFLYRLLKTILYCIDFIMSFAGKLVGVNPVHDADGNEVELLNFFFTSNTILQAFKMVAMVGIVLLFLFTVFSVIRSITRLGEGKSALQVCLGAAKTLFYFMLMPFIMILSSSFITAVMTSIYRATMQGGTSLGSAMFTLFADEAYNGGGNKEAILDEFRASGPFVAGNSDFNYYSMGDVKDYFSLSKMNYFLGFVAGVVVLILLVLPMISYIERIVSLLLLFIVSPISIASSVLDDGMRFKLWRDQVINKFITAYGSILSLNIFVLMVGVVYDVTFFPNSSFLNGMARLLFVLGGAFACRMGAVLVGNLVNYGAGSQYAQDLANVTNPFRRLIPFAMMSRAKNTGRELMGTAAHAAANAAKGAFSSASGGAAGGRAGGDPAQRFTEKTASPTRRTPPSYAPPAPPSGKSGGGGKQSGQIPKPKSNIQDVLSGKKSGAAPGKSKADGNAANKAGAATVKDAMKAAKGAGIPK